MAKKEQKQMKFKMDVGTLSKVFQALEGFDFQELPIFTAESKLEREFISTLVLTIAKTPSYLNDLFSSMTGEGGDYMSKGLDELCEVAQDFLDNTPKRFKDTLMAMIDEQRRQKTMAIQKMQANMIEAIKKVQDSNPGETPTFDVKSVLEEMGLKQ